MPRNKHFFWLALLGAWMGMNLFVLLDVFASFYFLKVNTVWEALLVIITNPTIWVVKGAFGLFWGMCVGAAFSSAFAGEPQKSGNFGLFGGGLLFAVGALWGWAFLRPEVTVGVDPAYRIYAFCEVAVPAMLLLLYGGYRVFTAPEPEPAEMPLSEPSAFSTEQV